VRYTKGIISHTFLPVQNPTIYRVIQEESAILWEMIVCVILSKKVHMNMGLILNGYRDNITTNITCIVIRRVNHIVLLM
jgi:hypothetical protein